MQLSPACFAYRRMRAAIEIGFARRKLSSELCGFSDCLQLHHLLIPLLHDGFNGSTNSCTSLRRCCSFSVHSPPCCRFCGLQDSCWTFKLETGVYLSTWSCTEHSTDNRIYCLVLGFSSPITVRPASPWLHSQAPAVSGSLRAGHRDRTGKAENYPQLLCFLSTSTQCSRRSYNSRWIARRWCHYP